MVAKKTAVQQSASGRSMGADRSAKGAAQQGEAKKTVGGTKTVGGSKAAGRKTATKKAAAKKSATTKVAVKESATEESATKKVAASKRAGAGAADSKKTVAAVASTEGAVAETAATKRVGTKKASTKKAAAKAAPAKKAARRSAAGKGAGEAGDSAAEPSQKAGRKGTRTAKKAVAAAAEGAAEAAKTTGATTVVAKKTPGTATAAKKTTAVPKARLAAAEPGELAVRPGEDPWTPEEVAEARTGLMSEALRLRAEITHSEESLAGLMRDSGDGAGDDQADTGTKNITRESEMALAANAREMLEQDERALERLDAGTYGLCESCGNPIGKARMQAFPRATLCVECKQKQERRY
ncbi:TraR/DksA family transcriptional regulator [Streptomyces phaeochromogenes]|uniref:TraR/DksA family transcriptional regulator n=1 Tax=Streptomyces phaeochromogenes TaxID=1923 RepID=A0ABZ1HIH0_STRPH|nr:TraR/DksA family transcriptional regulator [Streptomyces phaeochromogenes]WSD18419.1 TraR/DksA family transcriptional regulator [Streptomyces phaeochromogenes]